MERMCAGMVSSLLVFEAIDNMSNPVALYVKVDISLASLLAWLLEADSQVSRQLLCEKSCHGEILPVLC
jgi:hypothetical protein